MTDRPLSFKERMAAYGARTREIEDVKDEEIKKQEPEPEPEPLIKRKEENLKRRGSVRLMVSSITTKLMQSKREKEEEERLKKIAGMRRKEADKLHAPVKHAAIKQSEFMRKMSAYGGRTNSVIVPEQSEPRESDEVSTITDDEFASESDTEKIEPIIPKVDSSMTGATQLFPPVIENSADDHLNDPIVSDHDDESLIKSNIDDKDIIIKDLVVSDNENESLKNLNEVIIIIDSTVSDKEDDAAIKKKQGNDDIKKNTDIENEDRQNSENDSKFCILRETRKSFTNASLIKDKDVDDAKYTDDGSNQQPLLAADVTDVVVDEKLLFKWLLDKEKQKEEREAGLLIEKTEVNSSPTKSQIINKFNPMTMLSFSSSGVDDDEEDVYKYMEEENMRNAMIQSNLKKTKTIWNKVKNKWSSIVTQFYETRKVEINDKIQKVKTKMKNFLDMPHQDEMRTKFTITFSFTEVNFTRNMGFLPFSTYSIIAKRKDGTLKVVSSKATMLHVQETASIDFCKQSIKIDVTLFRDKLDRNTKLPKKYYNDKDIVFQMRQITSVHNCHSHSEVVYRNVGTFTVNVADVINDDTTTAGMTSQPVVIHLIDEDDVVDASVKVGIRYDCDVLKSYGMFTAAGKKLVKTNSSFLVPTQKVLNSSKVTFEIFGAEEEKQKEDNSGNDDSDSRDDCNEHDDHCDDHYLMNKFGEHSPNSFVIGNVKSLSYTENLDSETKEHISFDDLAE